MALSAPFCPLVNLLSPDQSGRWLVGAVGIEFTVLSTSPVDSVALPPLSCLKTALDTPILWPSCGQVFREAKNFPAGWL